MEEAFVSFVIERLGNALIQEAAFLKGVRGQFERLKKELINIQAFLEAADMKRCGDPRIRLWVVDVKDIAYDVDDIIDSYILKVASKRKIAQVPKKILNFYKIGKEIESIFAKIEDIDKRRQRYGITTLSERRDEASSSTSNEIRLRRSYPGVEDENIIGLEEATNNLVAELMKESERLRVVSICGMGGIGKTTLAKRVYNHSSVKSHFHCRAWTFISQQCTVRDVLQEILRQVTDVSADERGKMSEPEMMDKVSAIFKNRRYLVVLDDIWNKEAWDMLKSAFPNESNGSKVMLTSRNMDVAGYADQWGYSFAPRKMNEDEAWDLILKIALPRDNVRMSLNLSDDMEKCGREMVKRCGGLPLAIVVLGGILARKKTLSE
ncbi:hypothetical protein ACHQM5_019156 [Ranunculus cassubicifolius]